MCSAPCFLSAVICHSVLIRSLWSCFCPIKNLIGEEFLVSSLLCSVLPVIVTIVNNTEDQQFSFGCISFHSFLWDLCSQIQGYVCIHLFIYLHTRLLQKLFRKCFFRRLWTLWNEFLSVSLILTWYLLIFLYMLCLFWLIPFHVSWFIISAEAFF